MLLNSDETSGNLRRWCHHQEQTTHTYTHPKASLPTHTQSPSDIMDIMVQGVVTSFIDSTSTRLQSPVNLRLWANFFYEESSAFTKDGNDIICITSLEVLKHSKDEIQVQKAYSSVPKPLVVKGKEYMQDFLAKTKSKDSSPSPWWLPPQKGWHIVCFHWLLFAEPEPSLTGIQSFWSKICSSYRRGTLASMSLIRARCIIKGF